MAINEPSDSLPLADILRAANDLVTAGLIEDWALGGALAAIYYVEPFTTYDADIFFIPKDKGLTAGIPAIYAHLQAQGWQVEREHLLIRGFPVQFLAASGLTGRVSCIGCAQGVRPRKIRRSRPYGAPVRARTCAGETVRVRA